jgi:hypothetical protein
MQTNTMLRIGVVAVMMSGCAQADEDVHARSYVAQVGERETFVAVVIDDVSFAAYVCDGVATWGWVEGELDGVHGMSDSDHSVQAIAIEVGAEDLEGTVTFENGEVASFTATLAEGDAGLYRAEEPLDDQTLLGGWIVLADGRQRGGIAGIPGGGGGFAGTSGGMIPPLPFSGAPLNLSNLTSTLAGVGTLSAWHVSLTSLAPQ